MPEFRTVSGLLNHLQRKAEDKAIDFVEDVVEEIQMSPVTPRRTGFMAESYRAVETSAGAEIVTEADYWKFVEYGTRNQRAQPHVRPAIEAARARWGL